MRGLYRGLVPTAAGVAPYVGKHSHDSQLRASLIRMPPAINFGPFASTLEKTQADIFLVSFIRGLQTLSYNHRPPTWRHSEALL